MATFTITDHEKNIVYRSLVFQRMDLKRQLDDLDGLINKYKNENGMIQPEIKPARQTRSIIDDKIGDRIMQVLTETEEPLTSRQVLQGIKDRYIEVQELDMAGDRKYMANVSARLTKWHSDNKIDRIKEDGKDAVYFIKKG